MDYILKRAKERSTWAGVLLFIAGAWGLDWNVEQMADQIQSAVIAAAGLFSMLTGDKIAE